MPSVISSVLHFGLLLGGVGVFTWRRSIHLMRYFQQEEYDSRRFWAWIAANRAYDTHGGMVAVPVAVALAAAAALYPPATVGVALGGAVGLYAMARVETDPRVSGKKKLVMTQRARRIHRTALITFGLFAALWTAGLLAAGQAYGPALAWGLAAALFQLVPASLMVAERLLAPGERRIQDGFLAEAKRILASVNPYVIGITGSYGKTSTKTILGELLSADAPTFWPPKSINTPMGVTREIRERLKPHHKWAIAEMGAYNVGSIRRLCAITPPRAAIVTAVGIMHLERFGSPENVFVAKSELAQAVPADGVLVCNGDDPGARRMAKENPKATTLLYGFEGDDLDCKMTDVVTTAEGSTFCLHWKGATYPARTSLHGQPMLANLMAAFTTAAALGVHPDILLAVARTLKPVDNRLQVQDTGRGTWIHDAYNSNPPGFSAALDVLAVMPGNRRILVTPGMVELGDQQAEQNQRIAAKAATICTHVYLVGDTNRTALEAGLREGGLPTSAVRWFAHRDEAFAALTADQADGDVVLIENDLPDLYEGTVTL